MDDIKSTPTDLSPEPPIGENPDQTVNQPFDQGVKTPPPPPPPPPRPTPSSTPIPKPTPPIPPAKEEKTGSKKKLAMMALTALIVIFGGISITTAWKLRQTETVTPEEAKAWTGTPCSGDCEIVIGPGNLTFETAGHGFRWHCLSKSQCSQVDPQVKSADIYVPFPAGATVKEAYAIWSGEGCHTPNEDCAAENHTTVNVNGQNASAIKTVVAQNPKFPNNTQAANIAKLNPASIPSPAEGKLKFHVLSLDKFWANGHGMSIIVIYEKQGVGYNKIILRLWGEWLYLALAPHDTRTGVYERQSASNVMSINLPDLDNARTNDNKFAWFAGEGELNSRDTSKKFQACIDDETGDRRASHLYYQVPGSNWTVLSPTDSPPAPFAWFACPMDPGAWWVSRVTGVNMPKINLTGNSINFAADSVYAAGENYSWGESYTFVGAVAQYPVGPPETPTPTPTPGPLVCLSLEGEPEPTLPGEEITLTCTGSSDPALPINHFEFRVSIDSGTPVELPSVAATKTNGEWEGATTYEIPDYACYDFGCRACKSSDSSDCTVWGQAQ